MIGRFRKVLKRASVSRAHFPHKTGVRFESTFPDVCIREYCSPEKRLANLEQAILLLPWEFSRQIRKIEKRQMAEGAGHEAVPEGKRKWHRKGGHSKRLISSRYQSLWLTPISCGF